jgi:F-type H+-transporting ATPase subunit b
MELIDKLGINLGMFIAQLINFTILIVVLSVFVYRPILRLLDDRRERVRKSMEDAKAIEHQKRELDEFRTEQMRKVDLETGKFLENAKHQAETMKKEILQSAEKEAAGILQKAKEQMDGERTRMVSDLQSTLASAVVKLSQKVIEREFSKGDQERLLNSIEKDLPVLIK